MHDLEVSAAEEDEGGGGEVLAEVVEDFLEVVGKEMGRKEFNRQGPKRDRTDDDQASKRRKTMHNGESEPTAFSNGVAVMIGYAGTGYKGLQINTKEKRLRAICSRLLLQLVQYRKPTPMTLRNQLWYDAREPIRAFIAAGNVLSLKLITEDPNVVENIQFPSARSNPSLGHRKNYWFIQLLSDVRLAVSFLGKELLQAAEKEGVLEKFNKLQEDAASFWTDAEKEFVQPILDNLDPQLAADVMEAIHAAEESNEPIGKSIKKNKSEAKEEAEIKEEVKVESKEESTTDNEAGTQGELVPEGQSVAEVKIEVNEDVQIKQEPEAAVEAVKGEPEAMQGIETTEETEVKNEIMQDEGVKLEEGDSQEISKSILTPLEKAVKEVKAAYIKAKKAYRIHETRRQRVSRSARPIRRHLQLSINYTILKSFQGPSSKRHIKSFKIGPKPIIIHDTEWLSLKVHVVRCGSPMELIKETYTAAKISIPKAPSLGLLLEAPVFHNYNEKVAKDFEREKLDFEKVENAENQFHTFFHHLDHHRSDYFLWLTASGISAGRQRGADKDALDASDDEDDVNGEEG
ncbi:hypothetical protein DID88_006538 [Monilinia fructigena]|uniref:Uncharacterized protein n=1 Tax=Monilinia fructigena TaxID=38457 RepID=A0A395II36_9HELO|nr:hypothetical protein DID88_006538 [Monilinia fructigena]